MRFTMACISDVHNHWKKVVCVPADFLIIAGDLTMNGYRHEWHEFFTWLALNYRQYNYVLIVAGNHDGHIFERTGNGRNWFKDELAAIDNGQERLFYLEHEAVTLEGINFFGTPYVPRYCQLGFNRDEESREELAQMIPDNTNVLVAHCPPLGTLDFVHNRHIGCQFLAARIKELKELELMVCGHVHQHGGKEAVINQVKVVNVAAYGHKLEPKPQLIMTLCEIETKE